MIKLRLTLLTATFLSLLLSTAFGLTARLETKNLQVGQPFRLIIETQDSQNNAPPKFAPKFPSLQNNFELVGTARNQSIRVVNNVVTRSNHWILTLIPLRKGQLTIPKIQVGTQSTQALVVNVSSERQINTALKKQIFLKAEVNNKNPYVQSEIIYSLKLFFKRSISSPSMIPPNASHATIIPLGKGRRSQQVVQGEHYEVFEMRYAVFPQKHGTLEFSAPIFRGNLSLNQPISNDPFDNFFAANQRPIKIIGPKVSVTVKEKPADFNSQWWLPAQQLTLSQQWQTNQANPTGQTSLASQPQDNQPQGKVGEPITRTITFQALALPASQLPQLTLTNGDHFKIYPSPAKQNNELRQGHVFGISQQNFVYIPTKPGNITIPDINIPWWNTVSQKIEIAHLPSQTIHVSGVATPITKVNAQPPTSLTTKASPAIDSKTETVSSSTELTMLHFSLWILVSLFILGLSIFSLRKIYYKVKSSTRIKKHQALKQLKHACATNDVIACKQAILRWANSIWPEQNVSNLTEIIELVHEKDEKDEKDKQDEQALISELTRLNEQIYGQKQSSQKVSPQLFSTIKQFKRAKSKDTKKPIFLEALYPNK